MILKAMYLSSKWTKFKIYLTFVEKLMFDLKNIENSSPHISFLMPNESLL